MREKLSCLLFFLKGSVVSVGHLKPSKLGSLLLNIHLNISVYGQDASSDKTFLHSKTPKHFMLQTIFLFHS